MTILTFNWHEAYLCTLAKTGHRLEIVERLKGGSAAWFYETRPLPANARIVKEATARRRARQGAYDAVVCHNVQDLRWASELPTPKVLVFHNMLTTELALGGDTIRREDHRRELHGLLQATRDVELVFISETKRRDWDLDGTVVRPGVDLHDYGGYRGELPRVLRVGNFMRRRDVMLGHSMQRAALGTRPSTLLGLNEPEDGARFTRSWTDLKECFRSHRVYLNTTMDGFEDGYNLATLEAMATGMPVVTSPNRTSPIEDGVNGYVSDDPSRLAERMDELLADRRLAASLGAEARETVARIFPMEAFVESWNRVLDRCGRAARVGDRAPSTPARESVGTPDAPVAPAGDRSRRRVLLAYVSYPATTARYLESALRRTHDVITTGPAIDDAIIRGLNLQNMKEAVKPHDVPTGFEVDVTKVLRRLPRGWEPDLFLWVESVHGYFPSGVSRLGCPTACYLIDSHLNLPWHLEWATRFDRAFVAQRAYRAALRRAGVPGVEWLPLACDPDVHGRQDVAVRHDIGFVGSLTDQHERRKQRLARLRGRFDLHVERSFLQDMARTMSASKIVFNDAVRDDLNMRVFESLATGSMLLTDRAAGSGLDEMFIDREHLVIYDDDDLEDLAAYYLAHDEERETVAAQGRAAVLEWHTYDHRAATLSNLAFGDAAARTVDPTALAEPTDPLVTEAIERANDRRPDEALERLGLIDVQRELDPADVLAIGTTQAACLRQAGRPEEADRSWRRSTLGLPATHKAVIHDLL